VSTSYAPEFRLETAVLFTSDSLLVTRLCCVVFVHMFLITFRAVLHCSLYLLVYYNVNLKFSQLISFKVVEASVFVD
jgi:hypothetical protein